MNILQVKNLLDYIVSSGSELVDKAGQIEDIGVKKQFLTEYDIKIERGIKEIIKGMEGEHQFYAEEENHDFIDCDSVWIADPISGTKRFINGLPHYAVVVSHLNRGKVDLAIIYDPSVDKLYTADSDNGVLINGNKILYKKPEKKKIIYAPTYEWKNQDQIEQIRERLEEKYEVYPSQGSFAINYCMVVEGEFDGVVSLTKDAFPEFAGCFIANQSGIKATNILKEKDINAKDRVFICGTEEDYEELYVITSEVLQQKL